MQHLTIDGFAVFAFQLCMMLQEKLCEISVVEVIKHGCCIRVHPDDDVFLFVSFKKGSEDRFGIYAWYQIMVLIIDRLVCYWISLKSFHVEKRCQCKHFDMEKHGFELFVVDIGMGLVESCIGFYNSFRKFNSQHRIFRSSFSVYSVEF